MQHTYVCCVLSVRGPKLTKGFRLPPLVVPMQELSEANNLLPHLGPVPQLSPLVRCRNLLEMWTAILCYLLGAVITLGYVGFSFWDIRESYCYCCDDGHNSLHQCRVLAFGYGLDAIRILVFCLVDYATLWKTIHSERSRCFRCPDDLWHPVSIAWLATVLTFVAYSVYTFPGSFAVPGPASTVDIGKLIFRLLFVFFVHLGASLHFIAGVHFLEQARKEVESVQRVASGATYTLQSILSYSTYMLRKCLNFVRNYWELESWPWYHFAWFATSILWIVGAVAFIGVAEYSVIQTDQMSILVLLGYFVVKVLAGILPLMHFALFSISVGQYNAEVQHTRSYIPDDKVDFPVGRADINIAAGAPACLEYPNRPANLPQIPEEPTFTVLQDNANLNLRRGWTQARAELHYKLTENVITGFRLLSALVSITILTNLARFFVTAVCQDGNSSWYCSFSPSTNSSIAQLVDAGCTCLSVPVGNQTISHNT